MSTPHMLQCSGLQLLESLELLSLLEFLISPGNTGSLLEFSWSSWKFLTDGMTAKAFHHKS